MAVPAFLFITIDATDAPAAAAFWSGLLGTGIDAEMDDGRFIFLQAREGLPVICIQRVPEAKQGKTRIHLDLGVDDLEAATARVLELGGSWDGQERTLETFTWRTCADPEGTEFDIAVEAG